MSKKGLILGKKAWCSIVLAFVLFMNVMRMGIFTEAVTTGNILVYVSVEDTAARIEGTNPVVSEAKGILLPLTEVEVAEGAMAKEAIQEVLKAKFPSNYTLVESSYGSYISAIAGLNSGENGDPTGDWGDCSGWLYLVNDMPASVGIDNYLLQDGDKIRLVYSCTGMGDDIGTAGNTTGPTDTPNPTDSPNPLNSANPTDTPIKKDDVSLNPDTARQTQLLEQAKVAKKLIADYIYINFLQSGEYVPAFGEGGEYTIFSLARINYPVRSGYFETYYEGLERSLEALRTTGKVCVSEDRDEWLSLEDITLTSWASTAMAVTALGKDATNVGGINIIEKLANKSYLDNTNEWLKYPTTLLAIITGDYALPTGDDYFTKEELAYKVADSIQEAIDSGYIDTIAMTLQPLAPFYNKNASKGSAAYNLKEKIEAGLRFLGEIQLESGYFNDWGTDNNPWSATQVMILLGQYGINPLNEEHGYDFIKNGHTVFDTMFEYIDFENGILDPNFVSYDPIQYLRGFEACIRYLEGRTGLFECADLEKPVQTNKPVSTTSPAIDTTTKESIESQSQSTSTPNIGGSKGTTKTGDNAPIIPLIVVMVCAVAAITGLRVKRIN